MYFFGLELALLERWRMILRIQKTITEVNHRLESVMLANFSLQRWVKGSFSSFSSLHLFFSLGQGNPLSLHLSRFYCPKELPEEFAPSAAQFLMTNVEAGIPVFFVFSHVQACQPLAVFVWCAESAQCGLDRTLWTDAEALNHSLQQENHCVSYPTHTTNISGVASSASDGRVSESIGTYQNWAFLYFSRWIKEAWAMFVMYLSTFICGFCWLREHLAPLLCYGDYLRKTNRF